MRRRRFRKIGEPLTVMPLPDTYPKGVLFIGRRSRGASRIVGTGFIVLIENPPAWHAYAVTASHVIEGADETFVRIRSLKGGPRDVPVPEWVTHPKHDVAVAPLDLGDDHDMTATNLDQFIDEPGAIEPERWLPIELGDVVYFLGLLGKIQSLTDRLIPIARAGVLAQMWVEDLPVKRSPVDAPKRITAHLIDCRSVAGFSGSPCYLQKARAIYRDGVNTEYRTLLLGLIGGHFDDWMGTRTRVPQGKDAKPDEADYAVSDDLQAPVSSGIGYVIPAEYIRETLMQEELVQMREADKKAEEDEARRKDEDNAATMDSAEGDSEFDRFEDLTRKLVNTPKPKPEGEGSG